MPLSLYNILKKALERRSLNYQEITYLLELHDKESLEQLQQTARVIRSETFGNRVFLYGFLYFSTYCNNNCNFCSYRRDNKSLDRYRKSEQEIIDAAKLMQESGVHLVDLTMGEDPFLAEVNEGYEKVAALIRRIRNEVGVPVMVSPGAIPNDAISKYSAAGADWFACYQETHSKRLFSTLRSDQSFDRRMHSKRQARQVGMLIEEGILTGVGETTDDISHSLLEMKALGADQVRVMTFIPQHETPMESYPGTINGLETKIISIMRLVMPEALIPASLDVGGLDGAAERLNAGANVVTSIVPPGQGLSGVANGSLDIEDSRRTVESLSEVVLDVGLKVASLNEYREWVEFRKIGYNNPTSVNSGNHV